MQHANHEIPIRDEENVIHRNMANATIRNHGAMPFVDDVASAIVFGPAELRRGFGGKENGARTAARRAIQTCVFRICRDRLSRDLSLAAFSPVLRDYITHALPG